MTKKGPSIESVTKDRLIEQYINNPDASLKDVAALYGVHSETVRRWLKRLGLKAKDRARPGRAKTANAKPLESREWLEVQLATKTQLDIARELGVSPMIVSHWANRHGLGDETKSAAVKKGLAKKFPEGRRGEQSPRWRGGYRTTRSGYLQRYAPDHPYNNQGYVMEHRLVMEEYLGRLLDPDEIVHHIDGNKKNNVIENLELQQRGDHISGHFKASHEVTKLRQRVADLERKVKELEDELARYK